MLVGTALWFMHTHKKVLVGLISGTEPVWEEPSLKQKKELFWAGIRYGVPYALVAPFLVVVLLVFHGNMPFYPDTWALGRNDPGSTIVILIPALQFPVAGLMWAWIKSLKMHKADNSKFVEEQRRLDAQGRTGGFPKTAPAFMKSDGESDWGPLADGLEESISPYFRSIIQVLIRVEHEVNHIKFLKEYPGVPHHLNELAIWVLTLERLLDFEDLLKEKGTWESELAILGPTEMPGQLTQLKGRSRSQKIEALVPIAFNIIEERYVEDQSQEVVWPLKAMGVSSASERIIELLIKGDFKPYKSEKLALSLVEDDQDMASPPGSSLAVPDPWREGINQGIARSPGSSLAIPNRAQILVDCMNQTLPYARAGDIYVDSGGRVIHKNNAPVTLLFIDQHPLSGDAQSREDLDDEFGRLIREAMEIIQQAGADEYDFTLRLEIAIALALGQDFGRLRRDALRLIQRVGADPSDVSLMMKIVIALASGQEEEVELQHQVNFKRTVAEYLEELILLANDENSSQQSFYVYSLELSKSWIQIMGGNALHSRAAANVFLDHKRLVLQRLRQQNIDDSGVKLEFLLGMISALIYENEDDFDRISDRVGTDWEPAELERQVSENGRIALLENLGLFDGASWPDIEEALAARGARLPQRTFDVDPDTLSPGNEDPLIIEGFKTEGSDSEYEDGSPTDDPDKDEKRLPPGSSGGEGGQGTTASGAEPETNDGSSAEGSVEGDGSDGIQRFSLLGLFSALASLFIFALRGLLDLLRSPFREGESRKEPSRNLSAIKLARASILLMLLTFPNAEEMGLSAEQYQNARHQLLTQVAGPIFVAVGVSGIAGVEANLGAINAEYSEPITLDELESAREEVLLELGLTASSLPTEAAFLRNFLTALIEANAIDPVEMHRLAILKATAQGEIPTFVSFVDENFDVVARIVSLYRDVEGQGQIILTYEDERFGAAVENMRKGFTEHEPVIRRDPALLLSEAKGLPPTLLLNPLDGYLKPFRDGNYSFSFAFSAGMRFDNTDLSEESPLAYSEFTLLAGMKAFSRNLNTLLKFQRLIAKMA